MRYRKNWFVSSVETAESLPRVPLVEIVGQRRVLIENHSGVMSYSAIEICVKVKYGVVCVCGEGMHLANMTKEQLVITGHIGEIKLMGGKC